MVGVISDVNIEGHFNAILRIVQGETWRDLWERLGVRVETIANLGLAADVSDATLWRLCQQEELVLVTGNRNKSGEDSLEATIRLENDARCLPVLTLGDPDRALSDRIYQEDVAEALMEYMLAIENYRGTGRLYLP